MNEEMTKWYTDNRDRWISFMSRQQLSKEDAEDIMSEVYIMYFNSDVDSFSIGVANSFVMNRMRNYIRDADRYNKMLSDYSDFMKATSDEVRGDVSDIHDIIIGEIATYNKEKTRCVLTKHIIEGERLEGLCGMTRQAAGMAVRRFKDRMIDKYGVRI